MVAMNRGNCPPVVCERVEPGSINSVRARYNKENPYLHVRFLGERKNVWGGGGVHGWGDAVRRRVCARRELRLNWSDFA